MSLFQWRGHLKLQFLENLTVSSCKILKWKNVKILVHIFDQYFTIFYNILQGLSKYVNVSYGKHNNNNNINHL